MKKQNKAVKYMYMYMFMCLLIVFGTSKAEAEDKAGIGFEIMPVFSSNQIDTNKGYYYLETEPGKKQEIEMIVTNIRDEPMTIVAFVENAISSRNGNIGYSADMEKVHESLKNPITEIIVPREKEFVIQPGENKRLFYDLTPPDTSFEGVKLGMVKVKEATEKETSGVGQEYEYGLGVVLSEDGKMFNDGNNLLLSDVEPLVSNGSKVIQGVISNPDPKTVEKLTVESYVTKKGSKEKIKEKKIENFSFAPNSKSLFQIPWGLGNFETGEYTFHFVANNEFDSFNLSENFQIRGEDAKRLNSEAAFAVNTPNRIKIIIISLNVTLILLSATIIVRNKKWIKQVKLKKRSRNSKKRKR